MEDTDDTGLTLEMDYIRSQFSRMLKALGIVEGLATTGEARSISRDKAQRMLDGYGVYHGDLDDTKLIYWVARTALDTVNYRRTRRPGKLIRRRRKAGEKPR